MVSKSRRNETSCGASPVLACEEERICEMRTGRPVKVASTSRDVICAEPVKRRGACVGAVAMMIVDPGDFRKKASGL